MKAMITTGLATIAALYIVTAGTQERDDSGAGTSQGGEIYLGEIRVACEAEATGLVDQQNYIEQCIKNMKQSFTGAHD